MRSKVVVLLLCTILLAGCGKITSGVIINKPFTPAHTAVYYTHMKVGKSSISVPHYYKVPDAYYVVIADNDEKGKTHKAEYKVTEERYNEVNIGERFVVEEDK